MFPGNAISTTSTRFNQCWFAVLLFVSGLVTSATAQQYQADEVDKKAGMLGLTAESCAKDSARYTADKDKFTEYFTKFYFPQMTQFAPEDLAKLGGARYSLFNKFLWPSKSEALQHDLTELAFESSNRMLPGRENYHPAVKYNAILILGMLDDQYAIDSGADKRPPKPLVKANEVLVKIVEYAGQGKRIPPSMLVGALVGLERHAQYHDSFDRPHLEAMTNAAIKLAALEPPAPDLEPPVAEWIKLQTATVLAELGTVGPNNQVHAALMKYLADPGMSLDVRGRIAALFGMIKYDGANIDAKATATGIVNFANEVGQAEAKRAKEFQDSQLTGGGGYSPSVGRGEPGGRRTEYGQPPDYDRRTLLSRLGDVRRGLTALKPVVPADQQAGVDAILTAIKPVVDAAENKDVISLDLVGKVQKMADDIQRVAKPAAPLAAKDKAGGES